MKRPTSRKPRSASVQVSARPTASLSLLGRRAPLPASPGEARLEAFPNPYPGRDYTIRFDCPEFTSLCPVTGQPDFGRITIEYVPGPRCVESKSLKLYLGSFRNEGSFAESIANRIRDDLVKAARPRRLTVTADFTPRGGIGLRVVAEFPGRGS